MSGHNYPQHIKRKDINLHIKIDQTTKEELDMLCKKTSLTKSDVIRRSIHIISGKSRNSTMVTRDFLQKNGKTLKAMDRLNTKLNAIQLDYRRIGINLNQIAKKANMGELEGLEAIQAVNETIGSDVEKISQSVSALIQRLYA